jgi:hypothetical protein
MVTRTTKEIHAACQVRFGKAATCEWEDCEVDERSLKVMLSV